MAREKVLSILRSPRPPNTDRLPPPQDVSKSLSAFASALYRALWQLLRIKYYLDSLGIPRNGKRFVGFWNLAKDLLSSMMRGLSEVDSDSGLLFNKFPLLSHQSWVLKRLTKILKEIEAVGVKVQLNPQCESLRGRCGVRIGWLVGQFRGLMKM
jgi:hypothetical protein